MHGATAPSTDSIQIAGYSGQVARPVKPSKGPRPKQGAHLLALRKQAGLTQQELGAFLGVPQGNIAFWEWSHEPPRSSILPQMAKALGVRVEVLLVAAKNDARARSPRPVGQVQQIFDDVRKLPRNQQRKVVEIVSALVAQFQKKAS